MCCLRSPAANPKPNTFGQWHTGDTGETLTDPPPGPLPEALFSMGRAKSIPPCRKMWCWSRGQCQAQAQGCPRENNTRTGNRDTEPRQPQARGAAHSPERHPPLWLAGLGHFPATNTQAGPLPRPLPTWPGHVCAAAGCYNISPNISTAPASCDLPRPNPSSCPASCTAFLQTLSHFS